MRKKYEKEEEEEELEENGFKTREEEGRKEIHVEEEWGRKSRLGRYIRKETSAKGEDKGQGKDITGGRKGKEGKG